MTMSSFQRAPQHRPYMSFTTTFAQSQDPDDGVEKIEKIFFHLLNRGCEMKSRDTANTCSFAAWRAVNPDE